MVSIDGTNITGATIDGQQVSEITIDGQTAWTAILDSVVDDFEDNNLNEYSGNTGSFTTQTSPVYNGSYSLGDVSQNRSIYSDVGDGLPYYPQRGDTVEWRTHQSGGNDVATTGLFSSGGRSGNGYDFRPGSVDGTGYMQIRRWDGGSQTTIASANSVAVEYEWMRHRVESDASTLTYKVYDSSGNKLGQISATDSTYSNRGIWFGAYPGDTDGVRNWDYMVYG